MVLCDKSVFHYYVGLCATIAESITLIGLDTGALEVIYQ